MINSNDDRINNDCGKITSIAYTGTIILLLVEIIIKLQLTINIKYYFIDCICILIYLLYLLLNSGLIRILSQHDTDENDYKMKITLRCYKISIMTLAFTIFPVLARRQVNFLYALDIAVWLIPSLILSVYSIIKNLHYWNYYKNMGFFPNHNYITFPFIIGFSIIFQNLFSKNAISLSDAITWGSLLFIIYKSEKATEYSRQKLQE